MMHFDEGANPALWSDCELCGRVCLTPEDVILGKLSREQHPDRDNLQAYMCLACWEKERAVLVAEELMRDDDGNHRPLRRS